MSEYDENRAATQTGALPEDIAQAVRRYVAISGNRRRCRRALPAATRSRPWRA